jgi:hypothetical protein
LAGIKRDFNLKVPAKLAAAFIFLSGLSLCFWILLRGKRKKRPKPKAATYNPTSATAPQVAAAQSEEMEDYIDFFNKAREHLKKQLFN